MPLPTIRLAEYIENTIQILIVVLAFLITYKVFTVEDTDVQKFLRSFRSRRSNKDDAEFLGDDAEFLGHEAGRLANKYMKNHGESNEQQTTETTD